ncbi:asparaginase [Propionibacteriaceae bacterium Y1700]|uniref:asparaginase n=1 Tax=Microlunatus sp. Y1700 TaxID=3418487 RepID=UPI003DA7335D
MSDPIAVEVVRNGFVESVHHARAVVTNADGTVAYGFGDVEAPMYPRSSSKPMQAIGMLRLGLDLDGELLALAAASHSGEAFHREGARRILAGVDLDETALQNTPDLPVDDEARVEWIREGRGPERIAMNCSGKHSAMIATAVRAGHDHRTYLDREHPVQQEIVAAIGDLSGGAVTDPAIDGCGAPLVAVPLSGLARAFGRIAAATEGPERRLADAYRAHPEWASGTRRDEVELHRAIPGLVCKAGAEAVHAIGLPDGRGIALKISDGYPRARAGLAAGILRALGYDHPTLDRHVSEPVLGHGERVGEIRPVQGLESLLGL